MRRSVRALAAALPTFMLSGCFALEAALEPRASALMQVPAQVTMANVFDCVQSSIPTGQRGWLDTSVSRIDRTHGVIETGNYSRSNLIGLRTRTVFVPEARLLFLRLKGAGIYYTDLGVDQAALDLRRRVGDCLAATVTGTMR